MLRPITSFIRRLADKDPRNSDPATLFQMIHPALVKMSLADSCKKAETQIVEAGSNGSEGKALTDKKGNILYRIPLNRQTVIDDDRIDRIKRTEDSFEGLQRSKTGEMEIFLYAPPPPQEGAGAAPE